MNLFSKTYRGILILLLFINFIFLAIFDFNIFGLAVLLFALFLFIVKLKRGPMPIQQEKTTPIVLAKIRGNKGWKKNLLVASISILIALAAFIAIIIIALGGSPIDMWQIGLVFIILYGLTVLAFRVLNTNMVIIQTLLVFSTLFFTYQHIHISKALWPNEEGKVFGLSSRKYNKIHSGGWDWGEDWHRVKVSKEELPIAIKHFGRYGNNKEEYLTKDTIKVIPFNSIIGLNEVKPYEEIKTPCLHWYRKTNYDHFPQIPLHIYYEESSETLLVVEVTEF